MGGTITFKLEGDLKGLDKIAAMLEKAAGNELTVGIHGTDAKRDDTGKITNPELGAVHEFGTKDKRVPARPYLRPTYDAEKDRIDKIIQQGVDNCIRTEGRHDPTQEMRVAGAVLVGAVKKRIRAGIDPPITEAAKRSRARKLKTKAAKAKAMGKATPLIDTGQLVQSITAQIRPAGTADKDSVI